jgi:hypothetical protein
MLLRKPVYVYLFIDLVSIISMEESNAPSYGDFVKLLNDGNSNVIFALVDERDINFLSFEDMDFGSLPIEIAGVS